MPMLLEEPPLTPFPSMPPGPAHMPTPSLHWLPREELPIDKPECWGEKKKEGGVYVTCGFVWAWSLTWSRRATHAVPLLLGSLLLLLLQEPFGFLLHFQQSQCRRLSRFGEPRGGGPGPA